MRGTTCIWLLCPGWYSPSRHKLSRASLRVFSTHWCPWWSCCRISFCIAWGISIWRPLNITPDSIASSSRNDQYGRMSVGNSLMVSGHPVWTLLCSSFSRGSCVVSSRSSCRLCGGKLISAIVLHCGSSITRSMPWLGHQALFRHCSPDSATDSRYRPVPSSYQVCIWPFHFRGGRISDH